MVRFHSRRTVGIVGFDNAVPLVDFRVYMKTGVHVLPVTNTEQPLIDSRADYTSLS